MKKVKKPSIALRRKFAPLIAACRKLIITAPSQTSGTGAGDKTIYINIKWPTREGLSGRMLPDMPEDFPTGTYVERDDKFATVRHSVVAILSWMKAHRYTDYDAKDLFAARLPVMMINARMEGQLMSLADVDKNYEIDVDVSQN